jgi:choline dehydrogenase-like flavoprotein
MSERYDVVVVGSGAGGGIIASELAGNGRSVLLLEAGPYRTANQFTRWESKAAAELWWPMRFAMPAEGMLGAPIPMIGGRCVGGTTTINTKVALRASQREFDKWHAASGLTNGDGAPFAVADLEPHYTRVEERLGVRERTDWPKCVATVKPGFEAMGCELESVMSYTDENCMKCGSCLQGCPTNAGKSTQNTYIQHALTTTSLVLRTEVFVERVSIEDRGDGPQATGVEYSDAAGEHHAVDAGVVVVAGGALNSPQLLTRSGVSNPMIGRNLGFHPAQFAFGLFDEPQDSHMVYPITTHCMDHQADDAGGFVIEAATIQDPIGFTVSLCDENGPMWGRDLVEAARLYRRWVGLLILSNDDNNGRVITGEDGGEAFETNFQPHEIERMDQGMLFARAVLEAAGATRILWSGPSSTHVQGTCRMGADPAASVVDAHGPSHDVKRLFVGDGSVMPRTLSVNPSLTIMALADRLSARLHADPDGYLLSS